MGVIMKNKVQYTGTGGGFKQTLLWSGDLTTTASPVTLSDDITNYKQIQIIYSFHSSSTIYRKAVLYPVDYIELGTTGNLQEGLFYQNGFYSFISVEFPTATTFQIDEKYIAGWGAHVLAIYGIN